MEVRRGHSTPLTAETLAVALCKIMWQEEQHLGLTADWSKGHNQDHQGGQT